MSKRFTDTEKWERPWFRQLPLPYKALWSLITDRCDLIGVWYVDMELASFYIGATVTAEEALKHFEKQIVKLDDNRWFIPSFVPFQYGELKPNNNLHLSVMARLKAIGIRGTPAPDLPLKRGQGKGTGEGVGKGVSTGEADETFEQFWDAYPKKRSKGDAQKAWRALKPSAELVAQMLSAIELAKTSEDWLKDGGAYVPYPATWLRAKGWLDDVKPVDIKLEAMVRGWKDLQGVDPDDSVWDTAHRKPLLAPAQSLLNLFDGDVRQALTCMEAVYTHLTTKRKLTVTSLQAIVNNSGEFRKNWLEQKAKREVAA